MTTQRRHLTKDEIEKMLEGALDREGLAIVPKEASDTMMQYAEAKLAGRRGLTIQEWYRFLVEGAAVDGEEPKR